MNPSENLAIGLLGGAVLGVIAGYIMGWFAGKATMSRRVKKFIRSL